jgi:hypothetical protein
LLKPWYTRRDKLEGEPARAKQNLALFTLRRDEIWVIREGVSMYDYLKDSKCDCNDVARKSKGRRTAVNAGDGCQGCTKTLTCLCL